MYDLCTICNWMYYYMKKKEERRKTEKKVWPTYWSLRVICLLHSPPSSLPNLATLLIVQMENLIKVHHVEVQLYHADRRTERYQKDIRGQYYNVWISQNTTIFKYGTWSSYLLSTTCFGLYIGHHQVYITLKLIKRTIQIVWRARGGERDLVLQIVGSLKCRNLGWSIDLRCSCCRGAPWSAVCGLVYVRSFPLCNYYLCPRCGAGTCELV